eukprot:TRINITY_DN1113_c0_g1_i2.p1 TRINITY_DN1113_c0_g1~~TRINITY_DN1113_c0_g1_i2.p1  ORF type:complete len:374 (+),score=60.81 TRINITY_DN1113_c0_g1_i2:814-1935(+)
MSPPLRQMLETPAPSSPVQIEYSLLAQCYLEWALEKEFFSTSIKAEFCQKLAQLYLHHLRYDQDGRYTSKNTTATSTASTRVRPANQSSSPRDAFRLKWMEIHQGNFSVLSGNFAWLASLPPFNVQPPLLFFHQRHQRSQHKPLNQQSSSLSLSSPSLSFSSLSSQRLQSSSRSNPQNLAEFFYTRKLVGLLCSDYPKNGNELVELVSTGNEYPAKKIIQLLSYQAAGLIELAISSIALRFPQASLGYGKLYFKDPSHWALMLRQLLSLPGNLATDDDEIDRSSHNMRMNETNISLNSVRYSEPLSNANLGVYEAVLEHLTSVLEPREFLTEIVPENGSIAYFLPFIEKCYCQFKSTQLKRSIELETLKAMSE